VRVLVVSFDAVQTERYDAIKAHLCLALGKDYEFRSCSGGESLNFDQLLRNPSDFKKQRPVVMLLPTLVAKTNSSFLSESGHMSALARALRTVDSQILLPIVRQEGWIDHDALCRQLAKYVWRIESDQAPVPRAETDPRWAERDMLEKSALFAAAFFPQLPFQAFRQLVDALLVERAVAETGPAAPPSLRRVWLESQDEILGRLGLKLQTGEFGQASYAFADEHLAVAVKRTIATNGPAWLDVQLAVVLARYFSPDSSPALCAGAHDLLLMLHDRGIVRLDMTWLWHLFDEHVEREGAAALRTLARFQELVYFLLRSDAHRETALQFFSLLVSRCTDVAREWLSICAATDVVRRYAGLQRGDSQAEHADMELAAAFDALSVLRPTQFDRLHQMLQLLVDAIPFAEPLERLLAIFIDLLTIERQREFPWFKNLCFLKAVSNETGRVKWWLCQGLYGSLKNSPDMLARYGTALVALAEEVKEALKADPEKQKSRAEALSALIDVLHGLVWDLANKFEAGGWEQGSAEAQSLFNYLFDGTDGAGFPAVLGQLHVLRSPPDDEHLLVPGDPPLEYENFFSSIELYLKLAEALADAEDGTVDSSRQRIGDLTKAFAARLVLGERRAFREALRSLSDYYRGEGKKMKERASKRGSARRYAILRIMVGAIA
jgi:hypothetical protein